ncbi:hypothetical protein NDU88_004047 [Pleurodeles waltl]|uniref:Uncharacterized protein n=1 Tax=Pleurodeles waltl TaxID=8319 RepID=A0AAV7PIM5_PLEWA|nr:hypothetical protein NDU88_004047 [Pleurodeles waltl]
MVMPPPGQRPKPGATRGALGGEGPCGRRVSRDRGWASTCPGATGGTLGGEGPDSRRASRDSGWTRACTGEWSGAVARGLIGGGAVLASRLPRSAVRRPGDSLPGAEARSRGDRRHAGRIRVRAAGEQAETAAGPRPALPWRVEWGRGLRPDRQWSSSGQSGGSPGAGGAVEATQEALVAAWCVAPPSLAVGGSPGCNETAPGKNKGQSPRREERLDPSGRVT